MRVLAFRHVPFEHLGLIAPALESRGVTFEYVDWFRDPRLALREEEAPRASSSWADPCRPTTICPTSARNSA